MMKRYILILATAIMTAGLTNAQTVNIPDANFKAYLVGNSEINTNGDDEIQVSEAAAFSGDMSCSLLGIADLTGIETFTALTLLDCNYNQLTTIDISANTALSWLHCGGNQLTNLDLSSNTGLTWLHCGSNQLTALNLGLNTALTTLYCPFNQFTWLDLSANTLLESLHCGSNQLSALDVSSNNALRVFACQGNELTMLNVQNGNNINFTTFLAYDCPSLTCIQVDDAEYCNDHWLGDGFSKDAQASYSENCSTINISEVNEFDKVTLYPNPTRGLVYFSEQTNVQLTSATGQLIEERKNVNTLDISDQPTGIYFITHIDKSGQVVQKSKVVKE